MTAVYLIAKLHISVHIAARIFEVQEALRSVTEKASYAFCFANLTELYMLHVLLSVLLLYFDVKKKKKDTGDTNTNFSDCVLKFYAKFQYKEIR